MMHFSGGFFDMPERVRVDSHARRVQGKLGGADRRPAEADLQIVPVAIEAKRLPADSGESARGIEGLGGRRQSADEQIVDRLSVCGIHREGRD